MMKLLLCFADFPTLAASAPQVQCLFRTLYALYVQDGPHAEEMRVEVFDFAMRTALRNTRFIPAVIGLGRCVHKSPLMGRRTLHSGRPLYYAVLEQLKSTMLTIDDAALLRDFGDFLYLFGALAGERSIDPST
jgi:hypothetical protein